MAKGDILTIIDRSGFGWMIIGGKKYASDLIIYPDGGIEDSWRRGSGHRLSSSDITSLIEAGPDVIIAGTGVNGLMRPEKELEELLSQKSIEFIPAPNEKAVLFYNSLTLEKTVGACFHLTC